MPELPEVETIVRGLADDLPGARIASVEVLRPDLVQGEPAEVFAQALRGRRIERVSRRAKNIVLELDDGGRLVINLGMTGRVLSSLADESLRTHLGVRIRLEDGREVLYHDVRRFGRLTRMSPEGWAEWEERQGIEPLADDLTPAHLYELTRRSRVAVKVWLMDQRNVVGVGNIYASEALFRAKLDPRKPANRLTKKEAARVRDGVQSVLREAIEFRGTTFLDYRDAAGEEGAFYERLRVYDREGKPCTACGTPITRLVQGGRSTFYCPRCQH